MLEDEEKRIKPIVFISLGVLLFMIVYILFSGKTSLRVSQDNTPVKINIDELFSNIKDNYTIRVTEEHNDTNITWEYDREKDLILYDLNIDTPQERGYLVYNNKTYLFDDEYNISPSDDIITDKDNFINLKLIKNVLKECDFTYVTDNSSKCTIDTSKYIEKYNEYYNTEFTSIDSKTDISIVYYSNEIHDINIDYTNINKIINERNEYLKYKITLSNINENDFTDIFNYYKDKMI